MSKEVSILLANDLSAFLAHATAPLIVVLGPTASGKTAVSLNLAERIQRVMVSPSPSLRTGSVEPDTRCRLSTTLEMTPPGIEIINADSRQLYKYLNIGTAKITRDEMHGIPHHLIDVLDPKEEVTAAWYKEKATETILEIHARKHIPMLVGGSMLYISAVIDDLQFVSSAEPEVRRKLEAEYDRDGGASLFKRLQEEDPDTAASFSVKNKPYVIRAMEILETHGKPSALKRGGDCPFDLFLIGVTQPREVLNQRIEERTKKMFDDGWIDEVASLLKCGYTVDDPGMKSVGYCEIFEALSNAECRMQNAECWEQLMTDIAAKTKKYAKRQMTWWRGDERIHWVTTMNGHTEEMNNG